MMIVRLSGHSGAGKSRLTAALPRVGVKCQRTIIYTSRPAREGETHGKDYYFLSRAAIAALPDSDFYIGPVREMLQAVDLMQLESELRYNGIAMIEIFADLWPGLIKKLEDRIHRIIPSASVFMTAIDPKVVLAKPDDDQRSNLIQSEITRILTWRGKDEPDKIKSRAKSAVKEILDAIGPNGNKLYTKVFHSSPEGPDGKDEWTIQTEPIDRAKQVLDEFVAFFKSVAK